MEIDKHLSHSLYITMNSRINNYQLQVGIGRFPVKTSHNVRYFTIFLAIWNYFSSFVAEFATI